MHLFITDFTFEGEKIKITQERVVKHMGTVLRMRKTESFMLQAESYFLSKDVKRYIVEIEEINKQEIIGKVIECKKSVKFLSNFCKIVLCIALPNTGSKLNFMVQKATEVGVDEIIFWKADRSQMKKLSIEKIEKLQKVALEASEQSQRWSVPKVSYEENIEVVLNLNNEERKKSVVVFDLEKEYAGKFHQRISEDILQNQKRTQKNGALKIGKGINEIVYGIIGPEGGLSESDYERFGEGYTLQSLGKTVLRMETAVVVGGRYIVNIGNDVLMPCR